MKFYGNESETVVVTEKGIFLIQSPDMTSEYETLSEIPSGFDELPDTVIAGLEVPGEVL